MRSGSLLVTAALLLALTGCVPTNAHPSASAHASASSVFASDAEALAAAEKAYAAYLRVSDQIGQDGGKDPQRFADVVSSNWLPTELASAAKLEQSGRHQTGTTSFAPLQLQQWNQSGPLAQVVTYTCLDSTATRFLDGKNNDVTPAARQEKLSVEVTFVSDPSSASHLLVDSNEPWSGPTFC